MLAEIFGRLVFVLLLEAGFLTIQSSKERHCIAFAEKVSKWFWS